MNLSVAFIILSLGLFYCIMSAEGRRCNQGCTREYNPVCGTLNLRNGIRKQCTFGNPCEWRMRKCLTRQRWRGVWGSCRRDSPGCF